MQFKIRMMFEVMSNFLVFISFLLFSFFFNANGSRFNNLKGCYVDEEGIDDAIDVQHESICVSLPTISRLPLHLKRPELAAFLAMYWPLRLIGPCPPADL